MAGKCPACGSVITSVSIEPVDIYQGFTPAFQGVSYVCKNVGCQTVLGVSMDPIALKTDVVKEVLRGLGKA